MNLKDLIQEAESKKVAIGHFNVSDIAALNAVFKAAHELKLPVIIGVSEGERDFIGVKQVAALVESLKDEYNFPIFLNADHTRSFEAVKAAIQAGFDAVIFDAANLPLEENIQQTKGVVDYVKSVNPDILVEGELGYIGTSSKLLDSIPEGAAIEEKDLTKPKDAKLFVQETGVDLLAPAIGNIHGILRDTTNPNLNIKKIKEIKKTVGVPLVLHGGSGIKEEELRAAIEAGISIIHINTEIRLAWRKGLERAFSDKPEEITPYKLLPAAEDAVYEVAKQRLKLFNKML